MSSDSAPEMSACDASRRQNTFVFSHAAAADDHLSRGPCSKACLLHPQTVFKPCIWFKEEPSQLSMGQIAQSLTCSITEKPHTGLDECPRILLSCVRARNSAFEVLVVVCLVMKSTRTQIPFLSHFFLV